MRLDVDIKSEFFTSREVADGLGISLRTLKNYRDEGRIQYHKFSPRRIVYAKQHFRAIKRLLYKTCENVFNLFMYSML